MHRKAQPGKEAAVRYCVHAARVAKAPRAQALLQAALVTKVSQCDFFYGASNRKLAKIQGSRGTHYLQANHRTNVCTNVTT